jgi:fibro-slime domain-containing protein
MWRESKMRMHNALVSMLVIASAAAAASCAAQERSTFRNNGDGGGTGSDGGAPDDFGGFGDGNEGGVLQTEGGRPPTSNVLVAVVRDFRLYNASDPTTVADFENVPKADQNGNPSTTYLGPWRDALIVTDALGVDGKPIYANASGMTLTTHGKEAFDTWYRDVPGTNIHVDLPIAFAKNSVGAYEYDSEKLGTPMSAADPTKQFFPIDDGAPLATAFGNEGDPHNYAFTIELHTTFTYKGGEFFRFRGDDDVFVYIDKRRVINIGGIHGPDPAEVNVDSLGLTVGKDYSLDYFSAERHKTGSNVLITTTLDLRPPPR